MQNVIYELLALRSYRIKGDKITLDHISDYCPFVENDKAWVYDGEGEARRGEARRPAASCKNQVKRYLTAAIVPRLYRRPSDSPA